ncbi:MAG: NAD(P)/FAD-dependent oxidoreductase [Ferrimicrobium sp.]
MSNRVVVVGSGPAGSVVATVLSRSGYLVTVVDRARFPRDKACGDVVGPRALAALLRAGIKVPDGVGSIGAMELSGGTHSMTLPAMPGLGFPGLGRVIRREVLDAALHNECVAAGATEVTGMVRDVSRDRGVIRVRLDGEELEADYLVGADGSNTVVGRATGLVDPTRVRFGFALRRYLSGFTPKPVVSLLSRGDGVELPGYGWAFPQGDGIVNIGVGIAVGSDRTRAKGLRVALDRYQEGLVSAGIVQMSAVGGELGGWLKMGLVGTVPGHGRVLLVGDAAGAVNPFQGEGIAAAVESGVLAARAIVEAPLDPGAWYRRSFMERSMRFQAVGYVAQELARTQPSLVEPLVALLTRVGALESIASGWGMFWNDLTELSGPNVGLGVARVLGGVGWQLARRHPEVRRAIAQLEGYC